MSLLLPAARAANVIGYAERLLARAPQMNGLGLSNLISNGDGSRIEARNFGLEDDGHRATVSGSEACAAIVTFGVVAFNDITCEVNSRGIGIVGVVEESDG